jgi:hypothetical protein
LREIYDDDDDKAHIDEENPKVIQFITASKGHEYMVAKLLRSDQGISHEVFREPSVINEEEAPENEEEGQEAQTKDDDILKSFRHIYVKEVVREPKMHFYKVPKLGAFMAVPLVYNSCLFEDALDNAVQDYLTVQKEKEEL